MLLQHWSDFPMRQREVYSIWEQVFEWEEQ